MWRQGERTWKVEGKMDSSPFLEVPGWPDTPTMSPSFTLLCSATKAARSPPDVATSAMICIFSPSAFRS